MADSTSPVTARTGARTERSRFSTRFSARDLMTIAIFAVIYVVVVFAFALIGIISPLVMLIGLALAPIAAGVPYMLFLARVKHAGMVTLFGIVVGLAFLATGQPWESLVVTIVVSALADLILRVGHYRSRWAAIWAYTVYSASLIGPLIPLLTDRQAYLNSPGLQVMGPEYVAAYEQTVTVTAVLVFFVAILVCAFLGGLLGSAVLRKHFVRAGIA